MPTNVNAMFSGHHHTFQVFNYEAQLPAQIVAGHGGDYLDKGVPADQAGLVINDVAIKSGISVPKKFGFATLEKRGSDWALLNYDAYGKLMTRCVLSGRSVACSPAS